MDTIVIKTELSPLRRVLSPLRPEKLLRLHTYSYITLLFLTAILIYYYTYPLDSNSTNIQISNELQLSLDSNSNDETSFYSVKLDPDLLYSIKDDPTLTTYPATYSPQHSLSNKNSLGRISKEGEVEASGDYHGPSKNTGESTVLTSTANSNTVSDHDENTAKETQPFQQSTSKKNEFQKEIKDTSFQINDATKNIETNTSKETQNNLVQQNNVIQQKEQKSLIKTQNTFQHQNTTSKQNEKAKVIDESEDSSEQPSTATKNLQPSTKNVTEKNQDTFDQTISITDQSNEDQIKEKKDDSFQVMAGTESNNSSIVEAIKAPNITDKFLVHSKNCKIPDIDPMHPSILEFVKFANPLVCKDKDPLTKTDGNILLIDRDAAKNRSLKEDEFFCCYRPLYRAEEGSSDNKVAFGNCHDFAEKANIRDEFIKVECAYKNETTFYEEYHSFIHDKIHVEERCNKYNGTKYSVLIIGLDSVSRMNMHRQLNKTSRYLLDNMGAFEMYGFNKVGDNTFPNLMPLLTGYDERELPQVCFNQTEKESLDKCNFLWKSYANYGYRTLYAEDSPFISTFNYVKKGFFNQPTDYYIRHFMLAYEKALGHRKRLNCYTCLGSVSATEAILHWAEQFASHFHDRPYFAFNWINSLTHDYMNLASSGDHFYEQFFRRLHQSGSLNKTIVILMGDHGMRWGPIRETYIGRLEERLPMLLIALPPEFKREFPSETEAMRVNSHRLVTPFDLHATLEHLLHMKENWTFSNHDKVSSELASNFTKRAWSLFGPVPEDRSCDQASIEEHWCTCESSLPMDTDDDHVKKAGKFLVNRLNKLLRPVRKMCAKLDLKTISDARVWSPSSEHQGHSKDDHILTVIVQTSPGKAMFEGTVRISPPDENCELLGTVSRLNVYGNQSACIRNAILRKYCYCL